jgi:hypothetical protein
MLFLPDFNHSWILSTNFVKLSNMKLHENPPTVLQLLHACRQTDKRHENPPTVLQLLLACTQIDNRGEANAKAPKAENKGNRKT